MLVKTCWQSCSIHLRTISQAKLKVSILVMSLKITYLIYSHISPWWHLSNMHMIFNNYHVFWQCWKIRKSNGMEGIGFNPTPGKLTVVMGSDCTCTSLCCTQTLIFRCGNIARSPWLQPSCSRCKSIFEALSSRSVNCRDHSGYGLSQWEEV